MDRETHRQSAVFFSFNLSSFSASFFFYFITNTYQLVQLLTIMTSTLYHSFYDSRVSTQIEWYSVSPIADEGLVNMQPACVPATRRPLRDWGKETKLKKEVTRTTCHVFEARLLSTIIFRTPRVLFDDVISPTSYYLGVRFANTKG